MSWLCVHLPLQLSLSLYSFCWDIQRVVLTSITSHLWWKHDHCIILAIASISALHIYLLMWKIVEIEIFLLLLDTAYWGVRGGSRGWIYCHIVNPVKYLNKESYVAVTLLSHTSSLKFLKTSVGWTLQQLGRLCRLNNELYLYVSIDKHINYNTSIACHPPPP